MGLSLREKIRYLREYNQLRREIRRTNPFWSEEEVCAEALDKMRETYGANADWQTILQMILEFLMKILPFFFLADEG